MIRAMKHGSKRMKMDKHIPDKLSRSYTCIEMHREWTILNRMN